MCPPGHNTYPMPKNTVATSAPPLYNPNLNCNPNWTAADVDDDVFRWEAYVLGNSSQRWRTAPKKTKNTRNMHNVIVQDVLNEHRPTFCWSDRDFNLCD